MTANHRCGKIEYNLYLFEEENAITTRIPWISNTARLERNDINFFTKEACGITDNSKQQNQSVIPVIQERSLRPNGFSTREKRRITNNLLPNKGKLINEHVSKVFCGLYSKDGKFFVNATQDRQLCLYYTHNGTFDKCKKIEAENVGWSILDIAFSPDNRHIAYSTWAESVYEYSLSEDSNAFKTLSFSPNCRKFAVFSLVYSNDGRELFGCANDRHIYAYDRECNQRVLRFNAHGKEINAIAFADNNVFYTAGDDALCKAWDRRMVNESDLRPVGIFAGHRGGITYIDSRGDSRYLITNSKDQSIKLWDMRMFSNYRGGSSFFQPFSFLRWDYRWQPIPQQIWEPYVLDYDTSIMTYFGHSVLKTLIRSRFSPTVTTGQRYIYTGDALGRLVIYDLLTGKILRMIKGHRECVRDVSWHPFYPHIITSSWDSKVIKWECRSDNIDDEEDRRPQSVTAQ